MVTVFGRLLLLFTLVPVFELWLLISVGNWLGAGPTIALVLGTGALGAWLAKREGFRVLRSWQEASAQGQLPKDGIIASVLVLVGGILLVTPGVLTDVVGLSLLIPAARRLLAARIRNTLEKKFQITSLGPESLLGSMPGPDVIDVDAHDAAPKSEA